jgi:hypothetical protein
MSSYNIIYYRCQIDIFCFDHLSIVNTIDNFKKDHYHKAAPVVKLRY